MGISNERLEKRLDLISNYLSNNFVLGVVEANRSEVLKGYGIFKLWDEAKLSGIYLGNHNPMSEGMGIEV